MSTRDCGLVLCFGGVESGGPGKLHVGGQVGQREERGSNRKKACVGDAVERGEGGTLAPGIRIGGPQEAQRAFAAFKFTVLGVLAHATCFAERMSSGNNQSCLPHSARP